MKVQAILSLLAGVGALAAKPELANNYTIESKVTYRVGPEGNQEFTGHGRRAFDGVRYMEYQNYDARTDGQRHYQYKVELYDEGYSYSIMGSDRNNCIRESIGHVPPFFRGFDWVADSEYVGERDIGHYRNAQVFDYVVPGVGVSELASHESSRYPVYDHGHDSNTGEYWMHENLAFHQGQPDARLFDLPAACRRLPEAEGHRFVDDEC